MPGRSNLREEGQIQMRAFQKTLKPREVTKFPLRVSHLGEGEITSRTGKEGVERGVSKEGVMTIGEKLPH